MIHGLLILLLWLLVTSVYLIDLGLLWAIMGHWTSPSSRQGWLAGPLGFAFIALLFTPIGGWAVGLSLAGLLIHLALHEAGIRRLAESLHPAPADVAERVQRLADRWRTRRPDRVWIDPLDQLDPGVMGLWRQGLILPAGALTLPEQELESVIAHELAHVAARDPLKLWLVGFARLLIGWLPGAAPLIRSLQLEVEIAADRQAAAWTGDSERYALTLGRWGLRQAARPTPFGVALTGTSSHLMLRLKALLHPTAIPPHLTLPAWMPDREQSLARRDMRGPQRRPRTARIVQSIHLIMPAGYLTIFLLLLRLV